MSSHEPDLELNKLIRESIEKYYIIQYNTIQYNTIQYNTIQYNTIQFNTIQYNTIQFYITLCNTIQYSTTDFRAIYQPIVDNDVSTQFMHASRTVIQFIFIFT